MPPTTRTNKPTPVVRNGVEPEVLSLNEAATFLRVDQAAILTLIEEQALPARKIGKEWRFLKKAIQDWLSRDPVPDTSKAAQLAVVGAWKNDPLVDEELREIYRRRRPAEGDR